MIMYSMVLGVVKKIFNVFKKVFMPDKKDFLTSLLISIPMYFLFGFSLIFLLPLIIAGVFVVWVIRRTWKVLTIYWTVKVMRKKTSKEFDRIKSLFK